MENVDISLFGGFFLSIDRIRDGGLISKKGCALIAYLAIESGRSHSRSSLASLLWPNQPEHVALTNLRQCIHRISQVFGMHTEGIPCFFVSYNKIQFNINCNCNLDVSRFSELLSTCDKHHLRDQQLCDSCVINLHTAVSIYKGNVLAGFSIPGCDNFQWWLTCRQEEYHWKAMETLKRLGAHHELHGDLPQAIQFTRRALELEPWSEFLHRRLIGLLALDHQRIAAIRQFEVCRQILVNEYGLEPDVETKNLYEEICKDRTGATSKRMSRIH